MNSERTEEASPRPTSSTGQVDDSQRTDASGKAGTAAPATVLVRGETVRDPAAKTPADEPKAKAPKPVSEAKVALRNRLPELEDEGDVGHQKDQVVVRDGKADIAFTGTLLASAAPAVAAQEKWQEYRIYETTGGKYVFSKTGRSIFAQEQDTHEAEVFDPSPSSMPSQLLRSVRDVARSQPLTWKDAAVEFFGYDPLAKALYRKLGTGFEERIS